MNIVTKPDLLIGAADLYNWSKVKIWATSARDSGFTGDIALLTYRVDQDVIDNAKALNIDVYQIQHDAFGQPISHNTGGRDTQAHQLRFFHAWQLLSTDNLHEQYRYVIMTDVRDVYFQRNPSVWLNDSFISKGSGWKYVASCEGILYKDEPWGMQNMRSGFGDLVWSIAQNWPVYNVGVLAGDSTSMMNLFLTIYHMTYNRYIPSDQSAFNILVNSSMRDLFQITDHADATAWAAQCGVMLDPEKSHYTNVLLDPRPIIKNNELCESSYETPYTIIHQYERVPELKHIIESKYI